MSGQQGFTLIELTIAIAIAVAATLSGMKAVERYQWSHGVNEVSAETTLILDALDDYYHGHCNDSPFVNPTVVSLRASGLLPSGFNADNAFGNDYVVSIDRTISPAISSVQLTLDSQYSASFMQGRLNANSVSGQTISWQRRMLQSHFYEGSIQTDFMVFFGETC